MIFLSHAAADSALAKFLETTFRAGGDGVEVFRTTRIGQIPTGRAWFEHIANNLRSADQYVVLLTPASQAKPWVSFEAGAAFLTGRTLVPVLGAGLAVEEVVEPLRNLQLLSLESEGGVRQLFADLELHLDDVATFIAECKRLGALSLEAALEADEWKQVECDGHRYAWAGPLEALVESYPVPTPGALTAELRTAGVTPQFNIPSSLLSMASKGFQQVWQIDIKRKCKHPVVGNDGQVLLVRPAEFKA